MPVKEKVKTIGVICKQPGYRAYCQLKKTDAMLWLFDNSKDAKEALNIAKAATINCGENICRFEWDGINDVIRKDLGRDGDDNAEKEFSA